jgi:glycosyltransferase involved in cell wall biosynthesis
VGADELCAAGIVDGVSFIITLFNKSPFLPRVVAALAQQTGPFAREFLFVDDGSSDGSGDLARRLTADWSEKVVVLRQENRGASAATNLGASSASHSWLKLVDGDDLLVPGATASLLAAAKASGEAFAYGALGTYDVEDPDPFARAHAPSRIAREEDGLKRFIRNCPANSSAILLAKARFEAAGGCDERLVSPDQALFLRLFARGGGARLEDVVALVPESAPGRLSQEVRRSRYESVLALYYLIAETPALSPFHARLASCRALSRAWRFARRHGGRAIVNRHFFLLLASRLGLPIDPARATLKALSAFTLDGRSERPADWLPGAAREKGALRQAQDGAFRSGG